MTRKFSLDIFIEVLIKSNTKCHCLKLTFFCVMFRRKGHNVINLCQNKCFTTSYVNSYYTDSLLLKTEQND